MHPSTGMLLNGTVLPPSALRTLMALHRQSRITDPLPPRAATPCPSPAPSDAPPEGSWAISPSDITPPEVPWTPGAIVQPTPVPLAPDTPDYGMYFCCACYCSAAY